MLAITLKGNYYHDVYMQHILLIQRILLSDV